MIRALLLALLVQKTAAFAPPKSNGKINGMQLLNGQWSSADKYDSAGAAAQLANLQNQTGANWIAMTFCWYQPSVDKPGPIAPSAQTPTDAELKSMTAAAHARDVKVLWRPCVDPKPMSKGVWRGDIGRKFSSSQWTA